MLWSVPAMGAQPVTTSTETAADTAHGTAPRVAAMTEQG